MEPGEKASSVFWIIFTGFLFVMGLILIGERWGLITAWVILFIVLTFIYIHLEEATDYEEDQSETTDQSTGDKMV